jgi:hypothetical protein
MKTRTHFSLLLITLLILFSGLPPAVFAQGTTPPVDPNSSWAEVVNPDGSINYASLTDGGVVNQPADWMPNIPLIGSIPAEYHVYYTPSGNSIVMPTASTLFFMAANGNESGFLSAVSTMGTSGLSTVNSNNGNVVGFASLGAFFGALVGNQNIGLPTSTNATDFFNQVISGQTNLWSLGPLGLGNFLKSLAKTSLTDGNLYSYMLMYAPGQCATVPGGCTSAQMALLASLTLTPPPPTEVVTPPAPSECPDSSIKLGAISASASLLDPPYPLVVGQDPDKRGVDVSFSASVAPTIYTYYTSEPVYEKCKTKPCGRKEITGYTCEKHIESYSECITSASSSISLSKESRDWILNELSIRYPEAYLHHPYFSLSGGGCAWSASKDHVQVADPGNWNILFSGRTSGTPVSGTRSFSRSSVFSAWLKEVVIVK